jgi:hypothetical protein
MAFRVTSLPPTIEKRREVATVGHCNSSISGKMANVAFPIDKSFSLRETAVWIADGAAIRGKGG